MDSQEFYHLPQAAVAKLKAIKGPIMVFGAGGFIGINILRTLLQYRNDVIGVSEDHHNNWRILVNKIPLANLISCDINDFTVLKDTLRNLKPATIFNLAAYGAYSKQKEYRKIYLTNFNSVLDIIEIMKEIGFLAYVHSGSSSEYGLNSASPDENAELVPNSHYAVSKVASSMAIKYYGKVEKLPVVNLRLYSVYGPWEEPDRLVPVLLSDARNGKFPPLVNPAISRDFIYTTDIVTACIDAAHAIEKCKGESFNIGTGLKTTIRDLVYRVKDILNMKAEPQFGGMENRKWDAEDWYANTKKSASVLGWKATIGLDEGLKKVIEWQKNVNFDSAYWNYTSTK